MINSSVSEIGRGIFLAAVCALFVLGPAQSAPGAETAPLDHGDFNAILGKFVDGRGNVDYPSLMKERGGLDAYVVRLGSVRRTDVNKWPPRDQLAFYINAYNAVTLQRIIDHYPPKGLGLIHPKVSIRNIKGAFDKIKTRIGGRDLTLDDLEHTILRARYREPRVHAAIVCASISCPTLSNEAYVGERLEEQLDRAARAFARDATKNSIDTSGDRITISAIFDWFKEDFERYESEVPALRGSRGKKKALAGGIGFLVRYGDPKLQSFLRSGDYKVKVADYDWGLNSQ